MKSTQFITYPKATEKRKLPGISDSGCGSALLYGGMGPLGQRPPGSLYLPINSVWEGETKEEPEL